MMACYRATTVLICLAAASLAAGESPEQLLLQDYLHTFAADCTKQLKYAQYSDCESILTDILTLTENLELMDFEVPLLFDATNQSAKNLASSISHFFREANEISDDETCGFLRMQDASVTATLMKIAEKWFGALEARMAAGNAVAKWFFKQSKAACKEFDERDPRLIVTPAVSKQYRPYGWEDCLRCEAVQADYYAAVFQQLHLAGLAQRICHEAADEPGASLAEKAIELTGQAQWLADQSANCEIPAAPRRVLALQDVQSNRSAVKAKKPSPRRDMEKRFLSFATDIESDLRNILAKCLEQDTEIDSADDAGYTGSIRNICVHEISAAILESSMDDASCNLTVNFVPGLSSSDYVLTDAQNGSVDSGRAWIQLMVTVEISFGVQIDEGEDEEDIRIIANPECNVSVDPRSPLNHVKFRGENGNWKPKTALRVAVALMRKICGRLPLLTWVGQLNDRQMRIDTSD